MCHPVLTQRQKNRFDIFFLVSPKTHWKIMMLFVFLSWIQACRGPLLGFADQIDVSLCIIHLSCSFSIRSIIERAHLSPALPPHKFIEINPASSSPPVKFFPWREKNAAIRLMVS
jgi:hypothetical protein